MGDISDNFLDDLFSHDPEYDEDEPETKTCQYCALPGLCWDKINGKWALVDVHGERHVCYNRPMNRAAQKLKARLKFKDI